MAFAFTSEDMKGLGNDEKAAVIATCIVTLAADGTIDQAEVSKFDAEFQKVPWGLEQSAVEDMIKLVFVKLKSIKARPELEELIVRTAAALPSANIKEKAVALAARVAYVHGPLNEATAKVLDALSVAMQIDKARMVEIADEVKTSASASST